MKEYVLYIVQECRNYSSYLLPTPKCIITIYAPTSVGPKSHSHGAHRCLEFLGLTPLVMDLPA